MILFVACTGPPLVDGIGGGTKVAELVIEEREVEEELVYVVPDIWLLREACDIVCESPGRLAPLGRLPKAGAVFVRAKGPWADIAAL